MSLSDDQAKLVISAEERRMLAECRLHVGGSQHRLVRLPHEFRPGVVGRHEQLQTTDMHGVLAGFAEQEDVVYR